MNEYFKTIFSANYDDVITQIEYISQTACAYCVLRFLNVQSISHFTKNTDELQNDFISVTKKFTICNFCVSCHNILPALSNIKFREKLSTYILTSGFEYNQYLLNVTIPPYYLLNDAIYKHQLIQMNYKVYTQSEDKYIKRKENFEDTSFKKIMLSVIPIKKAAKFILGPYLSKSLDVPVHYLSYFRCEITLKSTQQIKWTQQQLSQLPKSLRRIRSKEIRQGAEADIGLDAEVSRIISKDGYNINILKQMCQPPEVEPVIDFQFNIDRDPVYITGRYLKLQRGIAQTGDEKQESDEDQDIQSLPYAMNTILEPIFRKYVDFDKFVFHAAGREDIDVRMLGNGRPFIAELQQAKNACRLDWIKISIEIDQELGKQNFIRIYNQQLAIYEKFKDKLMVALYSGGQEKQKKYRAVCCANKIIDNIHIENLNLVQKTPIRVLHRRSLMNRAKTIFKIATTAQKGNFFTIDILASAGAYIKEFVHGDFGRTFPNLRDFIGADVEILQLDVMGVEMVWPPADVPQWIETIGDPDEKYE
ncbi:TRNA pseudouridine synthase [Spironucleus salmonicida]|uniref:tRNA pseudouridine(55) synthase n=1 Tax=Spironucleus salmonicida TaxID=348837 RepID=V6LRC1_9EUKA|nr:TRNA pseudouridine synthase [Spironucleus salmonicida]|eukprot:EST47192.1 tRNA pseudouridine synthase [Spironucleus salmonicida]